MTGQKTLGNFGGNVTLHPVDAPRHFNNRNFVAAFKR